MRLELTRVGLLVELAKHYTTRGALSTIVGYLNPNPLYMYILLIILTCRGVMVIVVGNGHGDMSSNPGQG